MRSASYQLASDEGRAPLSRRAIALAVVIIVHCLLIAALIYAARVKVQPPIVEAAIQMFNLLPPAEPRVAKAPKARAKASGGAAPRSPTKAPKAVKPPPKPPLVPLNESFDLAKVPQTPKAPESQTAGETTGIGVGKSSGPVYGPVLGKSTGPGGQTLYAAEWFRHPTHAELSTYMPHAPQDSWAEIACRTIDQYRVEDCTELDESPPGSGLSRGLRQAAWQFRIRPPRIDGKPQVGTWVRIRIDFTQAKEGDDEEADRVARKIGPER